MVALLPSYVAYAAAFTASQDDSGFDIDMGLVVLAVALAPLVFIAVAFISRNPQAPRRVVHSVGLLLAIGLILGLISPIIGAAAGFGVGIALCLHPVLLEGWLRRRLIGVALALVYMFALLVFIPAAGLIAGAVAPAFMVGFADEFSVWRESVAAS
jgi:hypothetical protein